MGCQDLNLDLRGQRGYKKNQGRVGGGAFNGPGPVGLDRRTQGTNKGRDGDR